MPGHQHGYGCSRNSKLGGAMTKIVLVHGVAQQFRGAESLRFDCLPALLDGLARAGSKVTEDNVSVAFYGDLFRPTGSRTLGIPDYDYTDVTHLIERELLSLWSAAVAPE